MKFVLLVTAAPFQSAAPGTAVCFARAALSEGHQILRIFFHGEGVLNANRLSEPPLGERDPVAEWSALAGEATIDLVVCSSSAVRRGIRDINLAKGFRISGLGQWIDACLDADRVLTFAR